MPPPAPQQSPAPRRQMPLDKKKIDERSRRSTCHRLRQNNCRPADRGPWIQKIKKRYKNKNRASTRAPALTEVLLKRRLSNKTTLQPKGPMRPGQKVQKKIENKKAAKDPSARFICPRRAITRVCVCVCVCVCVYNTQDSHVNSPGRAITLSLPLCVCT